LDNLNTNHGDDRSSLIKRINMMKILEKNLAELIMIGLFLAIFLSSCGIQFGNYDRYQQVYGNKIQCNK